MAHVKKKHEKEMHAKHKLTHAEEVKGGKDSHMHKDKKEHAKKK